MMSTRVLGLGPAFKQATLKPRVATRNSHFVLRFAAPKRGVKTQSFSPEYAQEVLNSQRLRRPSSPHFTIYQPQLTWIASIAHRATGGALSFLLYGFSISYLVFPYIGLPFTSADVVGLIAPLPDAVKYAGKALLAAPFAFHSFNGLRHLTWDMTKFITVKGMYGTGYTVLGATAVATIALMFA